MVEILPSLHAPHVASWWFMQNFTVKICDLMIQNRNPVTRYPPLFTRNPARGFPQSSRAFRKNAYRGVMNMHPEITADPRVMTGMPCIKGTRITVANVVRQVAAGRTLDEIRKDYPCLTEESIHAALAFAAAVAAAESYELLAS